MSPRPPSASRRRPLGSFVRIEEKELRRLYVDERQSLSQIATRFGTNISAVQKQMIEYDIPRRPALRVRTDVVMRKVVRQEVRPIGINRDGMTEEIAVDVLECGHTVRALERKHLAWPVAEGETDLDEWRQSETRRCSMCTKAQRGSK